MVKKIKTTKKGVFDVFFAMFTLFKGNILKKKLNFVKCMDINVGHYFIIIFQLWFLDVLEEWGFCLFFKNGFLSLKTFYNKFFGNQKL